MPGGRISKSHLIREYCTKDNKDAIIILEDCSAWFVRTTGKVFHDDFRVQNFLASRKILQVGWNRKIEQFHFIVSPEKFKGALSKLRGVVLLHCAHGTSLVWCIV